MADEKEPINWLMFIAIIVVVLLVGIGIILAIKKPEGAMEMLMDLIYWIPGMPKAMRY